MNVSAAVGAGPDSGARRRGIALLAAACCLAAAELLLWAHLVVAKFPVNDFRLYYGAARIGQERGWSRIYDLGLQHQAVAALTPHAQWVPYLNPPPLAWLVAPLAAMPFGAAYACWLAVLACCLAAASQLVAPKPFLIRAGYVAGALGLYPLMWNFWSGQVVLVVILGLALALWFSLHGHPTAAGLALVTVALKPQLALLVPLAFLFAGHRRTFLVWALATGLLAVAALASLGPGGTTEYLHALNLASGFRDQQRWSFEHFLGDGAASWAAQLGAAALAVAIMWRNRARRLELGMTAALLGSVLFARYLNPQDFTVLVLAAWLVLREAPSRGQVLLLALGYAAVELAAAFEPPVLLFELAWLVSLARPPQLSRVAARVRPAEAPG